MYSTDAAALLWKIKSYICVVNLSNGMKKFFNKLLTCLCLGYVSNAIYSRLVQGTTELREIECIPPTLLRHPLRYRY